MTPEEIEAALSAAEDAVAGKESLRGTGFWRAVDHCRHDRPLAERYADRIGAIDRRAFENGVKLRVRLGVGVIVLIIGTVFGIAAIVASVRAGAELPFLSDLVSSTSIDVYGITGFVPIAFLIGFSAILVCTHTLAHWLIGESLGIRFTHVFLGGPPPPRPGMKTDYASYLRVAPRARAVMHASGAVVTKLVPFVLLRTSLELYDGWPWLTWILLTLGVVQIFTDVLFSTKTSDWKKVLREWRAAKG